MLSGILFHRISRREAARRYLLIHGNETTAREVLREHMHSYSGVAHLVRNRTRNVIIRGYVLDPNRMFSQEGAARSLARWNYTVPRTVLEFLERKRPELLRAILPPDGELLIALHNNSEGYSVRDEVEISDQVSIKPGESPHNFFLCTDPEDYRKLALGPYNVVLQRRVPKMDDGSLSRLAARLNVRYVNLEVQLGQRDVQTRMLHWLEKALPQAK